MREIVSLWEVALTVLGVSVSKRSDDIKEALLKNSDIGLYERIAAARVCA